MVDGGTSCTATPLMDSSASLCRYALLAAMLSPKLETEKAHKKASLTTTIGHGTHSSDGKSGRGVASSNKDSPICTRSLWWDVRASERGVTILWS